METIFVVKCQLNNLTSILLSLAPSWYGPPAADLGYSVGLRLEASYSAHSMENLESFCICVRTEKVSGYFDMFQI